MPEIYIIGLIARKKYFSGFLLGGRHMPPLRPTRLLRSLRLG